MLLELKPLYISIIIVAVILIITCFILIFFKNKKSNVKVDEELILELISSLGGKDNIKDYSVENTRVKFNILDLNKLNQENLKKLSPKGIFITGNNVKLLLKYDSQLIIKMIDKTIK